MPIALDDDGVREAIRAMYLDGVRPAPPITAHELRMKGNRSRLRIGFKLPAAIAAALILIVVLFTTTPLRHRESSTSQVNSSPTGWIAHSAYGIQVSVPKSWKVSYFPVCADGADPGQLNVGASDTPGACPIFGRTSVVITKLPPGGPSLPRSGLQDFKRIRINGLSILVDASGVSSQWYLESERVSIYSYGPHTARVLATLRRSTPQAIPSPGIGKGTSYLAALARVPKSGPVHVRSVDTGKTTTVQAFSGRFSYEGAPGRYIVTTDAGSAPCGPIHVSLTSGTYSTWPPLVCQGE